MKKKTTRKAAPKANPPKVTVRSRGAKPPATAPPVVEPPVMEPPMVESPVATPPVPVSPAVAFKPEQMLQKQEVIKDFWSDMDQSSFSMPLVVVGQPTSKKGVPGKFNFNSGRTEDELIGCRLIVPMQRRVLYNPLGQGGSACKSDDFHRPSPLVAEPIHHVCHECPAAQWGRNNPYKVQLAQELNETLRDAPLCRITYTLLIADHTNALFLISFQGASLKIVKAELFDRLRLGFPGALPYQIKFDVGLREQSNPRGGRSFLPVFKNFSVLQDYSLEEALYMQNSKTARDLAAREYDRQDKQTSDWVEE